MDIPLIINVEITKFFFGIDNSTHRPNLVKKHSENLAESGDFSFPLDLRIWRNHFEKCCDLGHSSSILSMKLTEGTTEEDILQNLVMESAQWLVRLKEARIKAGRCLLFLDRTCTMKLLLKSVLESEEAAYWQQSKISDSAFYFEEAANRSDEDETLSSYRVQLVREVIRNLTDYSVYRVDSKASADSIRVEVKSASDGRPGKVSNGSSALTILCGAVIDAESNKMTKMTTEEYISLRSRDMQLMAMHKYGVRVQSEQHFRVLIDQLGKAAATVDLLEAKHTSPVSVKRNGQGSSKGASFILYNSARIETLLRTFHERVRNGDYPLLPDFDNIDISRLKEEDEWKLVCNYILPFPHILKRSLDGLESGRCAPHTLLQFLSGLVGDFSIYYRRVRILTGNREHLIPVIHARIYLVICIREILNKVLDIFSIKPVQHM